VTPVGTLTLYDVFAAVKAGVTCSSDKLIDDSELTVEAAARITVRVYVFIVGEPPVACALTTMVNTVLPTFIKVAGQAVPDVTLTPLTVTVALFAGSGSSTVGVTVRVGVSYDVNGILTVYEVVLALNGKGIKAPALVDKAERFALEIGILV
jgi:hypothetical protein